MRDFDVAVIGAGLSGVTAALLLARRGVRVVLLEAHTHPGGCAGYFVRKPYSFDVGATTWISFQTGGLGHELSTLCDLPEVPLQRIEEYRLCLPDRVIKIPPSWESWATSWSTAFPDLGPNGPRFFRRLAKFAMRYWSIAERKPSLPLSTLADFMRTLRAVSDFSLIGALRWFDAPLQAFIEAHKVPLTPSLRAAFNMLLQDTTQTDLAEAPAPMGFLGLTLMPYGLYRPIGGARAVWDTLIGRFQALGGVFKKKSCVTAIKKTTGQFKITLANGNEVTASKVLSSIPVWNTYEIAPHLFAGKLEPFLERRERLDSAFALYVGCRDIFDDLRCNHYQVLAKTNAPFGDGNNFLISLSQQNDSGYAPQGYRSISISCHTAPQDWFRLDSDEQRVKGELIVQRFISGAERLFPGFSEAIDVSHFYPASPITFRRFTRRYMGMAGNQGLHRNNTFFRSIPRSYGDSSFLQFGETTFPGAGTVGAILSGMNATRDCLGHWWKL